MDDYRDRTQKWYKTGRWRRIRARQLARYPYCQCPLHEGKKLLANVVDHKRPHRGDSRKFWNTSNLQSLTKQCHDSWKQRQERGGHEIGCREDGTPLDYEHHWNT